MFWSLFVRWKNKKVIALCQPYWKCCHNEGSGWKEKICATMGFVGSSAPAHCWWSHGHQKNSSALCGHSWLGLVPVQVFVLVLVLILVLFYILVSWTQGTSWQHILYKELLQSSWEQSNKSWGWRPELQLENHLAMLCLENASKHVE